MHGNDPDPEKPANEQTRLPVNVGTRAKMREVKSAKASYNDLLGVMYDLFKDEYGEGVRLTRENGFLNIEEIEDGEH